MYICIHYFDYIIFEFSLHVSRIFFNPIITEEIPYRIKMKYIKNYHLTWIRWKSFAKLAETLLANSWSFCSEVKTWLKEKLVTILETRTNQVKILINSTSMYSLRDFYDFVLCMVWECIAAYLSPILHIYKNCWFDRVALITFQAVNHSYRIKYLCSTGTSYQTF